MCVCVCNIVDKRNILGEELGKALEVIRDGGERGG